ncbi:hypothetical protein LOC54_05380 [Acetobacter sp. AN02]|uniref:hypothetical protein n=1 Tax=Acetobacter sp. AN02 TaxID=2894186 RepID=UPI0024342CE1|nr:hypothetical protein [Acetobacter sp. AN02]MDG6094547.1 hypothetical protein [Acetobacter sp. AN02]
MMIAKLRYAGLAVAATLLAACTGTAASPVSAANAPPGTPLGGTCKAGVYTCQLPVATPVGAPCSCPGLGAASYGNVFQK